MAQESTGADGRASFPPLAAGRVLWKVEPPAETNYLVAELPRATIRPGATEAVEIKTLRAVRVEGTVVEEPGGVPVAGVTVEVNSLKHLTGAAHLVVTDAHGRFSTAVLPGPARFSFWADRMPKTHFLPPNIPDWVDFQVPEGARRQEFNPPRLHRAEQVRGRVVDEAGKPVPGAVVAGTWISGEFGANPNSIRVQSDAHGDFVLGSIAPRSKVELSASTGLTAESEPLTVLSPAADQRVSLVLRMRPTLALDGRVLGTDGRPLADAVIHVMIRPANQPFHLVNEFAFFRAGPIRTDRAGRYRTPDQIPMDCDYRVAARAPGYEPGESPWVTAPRTEVPDVKLRPAPALRMLTGQVVDSSGKPLTGAEVYQSGDGPRKTRGSTGSDGRYRVAGVAGTPAFLFVAKEGYHFVGRLVEPADHSADFTLRRLDEPSGTVLHQAARPLGREEERAIARALIAETRKACGNNKRALEQYRVLEINALADPDSTIEMIENQTVEAGKAVLVALAIARFEDDPKKSLEILEAIDAPDTAAAVALGVFDRLGASATPGFRRTLLDRAASLARAASDSGQAAGLLAQVADRRFDLGEAEQGAVLIRAARALADRPQDRSQVGPAADLAPTLSRIDLPSALKLVEHLTGDPQRLSAVRIKIAERIAATDPAGARHMLGLIEDHEQPAARWLVCLRMAAQNLAAARALASEDRDPELKALLPAAAAQARVSTDPEGARTLLRQAVKQLEQIDAGQELRVSPAVALARLLPLAVRVDPERAADLLWLALARRPAVRELPESTFMRDNLRRQYLERAELAALVARFDRRAAEAVLAPVAARLAGLFDETWGLGTEGPAIFRAAGAFDARAARHLVEAVPEDPPADDSAANSGTIVRHHSKTQSRLALAEVIALPESLRLRLLFPASGHGTWIDLEN